MDELTDIRVRPGTIADADDVARVVSESWTAAHDGLLADSALAGRSLEADSHETATLIQNGPPGSGVHIAESNGSIVGVRFSSGFTLKVGSCSPSERRSRPRLPLGITWSASPGKSVSCR